MSVLGSIEIQLLANIARLQQDMSAAKSVVDHGTQQMQLAANKVKAALGGIAAGLTIREFAAFIKSGIDAADMANEVAQKTGLATKEVAGIQLAFKQGGVASEAMGTSLAKMAKQMVEGNAAFDALGIKTRNADGSLRSTKDVLYDTAEAFAGIKDGAGKTALAMEIFGKSGADMIPVLNGGAEGLREMAEMADKLGLTIDESTAKAADQFNDQVELLGMGMKGVSTQVAAQLLPTLTSLSASFLESMTSGDGLRRAADALATALKILYSAGTIGVEIFNTFGKMIGGVAAAVVAVAQGEFRQASRILEENGRDIAKGWKGTADTVARAWTDSGNATVQAMAGMAKGQREVSTATDASAQTTKKAAAEARKHADELRKLTTAGDDLLKSMRDRGEMTAREIELGRVLSAAEKEHLELTSKLRDGKLRMTAAVEAEARAQIDLNEQKTKHRALQVSEKALLEEIEKDRWALIAALQKETGSIGEQVDRQREQNLELKLGEQAYGALTIQRLRDLAAQKEAIAATSDQSAELREQARLLRERADLADQGIVLKEAKAAADEWQKTTDSIGQGLTDSLFRAFESGKDFFSTFWQGIKNLFKTTVLKIAVQAVMNPVNALLGSALGGLGGSANAAGGAAGGLGGIGDMLGLAGAVGSFTAGGGILGFAGDVIGSAIGAGASGVGAASGIAASIGTAIAAVPVWGWIAAGLLAIASSLDDSGTYHTGGGGFADANASRTLSQPDVFAAGGLTGAATQERMLGMSRSIAGLLNTLAGGFGGGNFGVRSGFADDTSDDGAWGDFGVSRDGQKLLDWRDTQTSRWAPKEFADGEAGYKQFLAEVAASTRTAIDSIGLPEWAQKTLAALGGGATLEQLAQAAAQISTLQSALAQVGDMMSPLGGVFSRVAGLSSDATLQLAGFAGGMDALITKTRSYVEAYYSEAEKAGIQAVGIKAALEAAGLSSDIGSKDSLRALVDSRDVATEEGRKQLAALLDVAGSFAGIVDYLGKTGLTLGQLADSAPQVALLDQATQQADRLVAVNDSVMSIGERITGAIVTAQASAEAGTAAVALHTATLTRLIQRFDDGDALAVRVLA